MIFSGRKKVELRRRIPADSEGREVYIYVTRGRKAICGGFRIGEIWKETPQEMWTKVRIQACLEKADFERYYQGTDLAYGLQITDVWTYNTEITLWTLRCWFSDFAVPQSWRYLRVEEEKVLVAMRPSDLSYNTPDGRE